MHAFNSCPQCNVKLQAFYLRAADESEGLEIDGCARCGGQWFDAGELEKVLGHKLKLEWSEVRGTRLCARCRRPLKAWKTKSGLTVESCDACRGTFLDVGELDKLGAPEAAAAAKSAMLPPGEFQCLKCQKRFPVTQGNAMGLGLVCRGCVPQPGENPLDKFIPEVGSFSGSFWSRRSSFGLSDLFDLFD